MMIVYQKCISMFVSWYCINPSMYLELNGSVPRFGYNLAAFLLAILYISKSKVIKFRIYPTYILYTFLASG